jgi:hypothetical protein
MKDKFFFSFTSTLLDFLRGVITAEDIKSARFCFNCAPRHTLPWMDETLNMLSRSFSTKIAFEASWAAPYKERDPNLELTTEDIRNGKHLIDIDDLPQEYRNKARAWNVLMANAEDEGRLFFSLHQFKNLEYQYEKESQLY